MSGSQRIADRSAISGPGMRQFDAGAGGAMAWRGGTLDVSAARTVSNTTFCRPAATENVLPLMGAIL